MVDITFFFIYSRFTAAKF